MWNFNEVHFFWEVDIWSKATYLSLKEVVIVLWLTKPCLHVSSGDWCNHCYKVKCGFFYASPYKDDKYLFCRPVLGNYLDCLALMGLECLSYSRSQSYSIHMRGNCTWGWALCVSVVSAGSLDAAGVKFLVWEQVLMYLNLHLLQENNFPTVGVV